MYWTMNRDTGLYLNYEDRSWGSREEATLVKAVPHSSEQAGAPMVSEEQIEVQNDLMPFKFLWVGEGMTANQCHDLQKFAYYRDTFDVGDPELKAQLYLWALDHPNHRVGFPAPKAHGNPEFDQLLDSMRGEFKVNGGHRDDSEWVDLVEEQVRLFNESYYKARILEMADYRVEDFTAAPGNVLAIPDEYGLAIKLANEDIRSFPRWIKDVENLDISRHTIEQLAQGVSPWKLMCGPRTSLESI